MGKSKYLDKIGALFNKSAVVSFNSISRIVNATKKTQYAKILVASLVTQGKIRKITKGFYTKHNDNSLSVFCFKPAYLGLQAALSFHDLWEQEAIPIIITIRKTRLGIREILGGNVFIRRMSPKYFFGFEYYPEGDFYLPYSDVEKTLIDMVVFNETLSSAVLKEIQKKMKMKKLEKYLAHYPPKIQKQVWEKLRKK